MVEVEGKIQVYNSPGVFKMTERNCAQCANEASNRQYGFRVVTLVAVSAG